MKLKVHRLNKHLTQEQLADISGLNVRTIQRIENGDKASIESLKCLASALCIDIEDITSKENNDSTKFFESSNNLTTIILCLVSLLLLVAAKSEGLFPEAAAFLYFTAAAGFVWTAFNLCRKKAISNH